MKSPTLLILAAGMASRYGSMKQIQEFGPGGETIMDYSIYDAIRAGFGKVVFIIRKDFEQNFKNIFEPKLKGRVKTEYVFQEMDSFIGDQQVPASRTKPWGTAHAVLCAMEVIDEPFAVINADDYYGREAFEKIAVFLQQECRDSRYGVVGYELGKTLSENGSVSRGVCQVNEQGNLTAIQERTKIFRNGEKIVYEESGLQHELPSQTTVSMNFWGFPPSVFSLSMRLFHEFVATHANDPKAEFFIPIVVDYFSAHGGTVKVIPTDSSWFGVTYKEDAEGVQSSFNTLVKKGVYPAHLWK
ncbi:MAG: sugar phosphate nucleotidyltransferase [Chitinophagaceae bacterium]